MPREVVSCIFHLLVLDLSGLAMALAALRQMRESTMRLARRLICVPETSSADWDFVSERLAQLALSGRGHNGINHASVDNGALARGNGKT